MYHRVACASSFSKPAQPQTMDRVFCVWSLVLVRCESLTALAHGPSASQRQSRPPISISCPDGLKTYEEPGGATPMRKGARARSRSTTLIGNPLCNDTAL